MTLGERIKKARRSLDLTQQKFADQIGSTQNNIASYEIGRCEPSASAINNICKTFNISEEWLRTGEGEMFVPEPAFDLGKYAKQHGMTALETEILKAYLDLDPEIREMLLHHFKDWMVKGDKDGQAREQADTTNQEMPGKIIQLRFKVPGYFMPMSAGTGQEAGQEYPEDYVLIKEQPRGTSFIAPVNGDSMEPTYHDGDLLFIHACEEVAVGKIGVFLMGGQQWVKELGNGVLISHNSKYKPIPMTDDIRCQGLVLGVCDESYFE